MHLCLVVSFDHLLVTTAQHQSDLCPHEPLLTGLFAIQVSQVLLKDIGLDPESLQELCHLFEVEKSLATLTTVHDVLRSVVLRLSDLVDFSHVFNPSDLEPLLRLDFLSDTKLERILAPAREGLLQVSVFEHVPEVDANTLSVFVEVVLASHHTNSLENFDSQSASGNSSDHIDCVLFTANVVKPVLEDVAALLDVDIVVDAATVSLKSPFKHVLHGVSLLLSPVELLPELFLLFLLLNPLLGTLALKSFASSFFVI